MRNEITLGAIFSLFSSLMWGATGIWINYLNNLTLDIILFYRFLLSLLVTGIILFLTSHTLTLTKRTIGCGAALCCYYTLATTAFLLADMVDVALIVSTTPVFIMGFERFKGIKPSLKKLLGAIAAFIGSTLVIVGSAATEQSVFSGNSHVMVGLLCALGAAITMAFFSLMSASKMVDASSVNFWAYLLGFSLLFTLSLPFPVLQAPNPQQAGLLFALVLFSTISAGMAYKYACQLAGPSTAAVVRLSTPLLAALLSFALLGKGLTYIHLIAVPFILVGVFWVVRS
ncbi:DMT family transporter [Zooshikella sp. RANM57]|uniref:DMT family transporter n=1 Tax=Zooshikella sp. RANM57 TaxID=3425863 RepID=UPI003D6DE782